MKKITTIISALVLVMSLASCGVKEDPKSETPGGTVTETPAEGTGNAMKAIKKEDM